MLTLKSLRVCGFRGFLESRSFSLNSPITILFGQNRCGKSSTLNAIEWGLFGSDCSGKQTNIRERVDWVIVNRRGKAGGVTVELVMESPDGEYVVRRKWRARPNRKTPEESVEVELPDGECLSGANASHCLGRLLGSIFRDFATTVYQHQEAIRAILTQAPRERNDAIDRLLGLSDHRNLVNSLNKVNVKRRQKDFLAKWATFENEVRTALKSRENDLEDHREDAVEAGVPRNKLNAKAALGIAHDVLRSISEFTTEACLPLPPLQVPEEWTGLKTFRKASRAAIDNLRGEIPAVKDQEELTKHQGKIIGGKTDLENAKKKQKENAKGIRDLDMAHGGQNAVEERLTKVRTDIKNEKARRREANSRATLIGEAITYLETETNKDRLTNLW
jgi:DNA repair exonuclease SbcCD ATPase subunit